MRKAPAEVERIVRAVLNSTISNLIEIETVPARNLLKYVECVSPKAGIRELLRGYRGDVFEVPANKGKFDAEFLYVVLPYTSNNVQLYVKMHLQRDPDDESLSMLWVVSLHEEGC
jgi:hypothetical protein